MILSFSIWESTKPEHMGCIMLIPLDNTDMVTNEEG